MMKTDWTVDQVKEELPDVKIKVAREVKDAIVRGRLLDFAHVTFSYNGILITTPFSWETIVYCLNKNVALHY